MALVTCPDCAAKISDVAPACPHCGRPRDGMTTVLGRANGQHGATKVLSVLLLLVGGFMFVSGSWPLIGAFLAICGIVCLVIALATDKRG